MCDLERILNFDEEILLLLSSNSLGDRSFFCWFCGDTIQVVKQSGSIGKREEQASFVWNVKHLLRVRLLLFFSHRLRAVDHFELSTTLWRNDESWFTQEIPFTDVT